MEDTFYTLKIKNENAIAIIDKLENSDYVEIVEREIPKWQMDESERRLAKMKAHPETTIDFDSFFENIADDSI